MDVCFDEKLIVTSSTPPRLGKWSEVSIGASAGKGAEIEVVELCLSAGDQ